MKLRGWEFENANYSIAGYRVIRLRTPWLTCELHVIRHAQKSAGAWELKQVQRWQADVPSGPLGSMH